MSVDKGSNEVKPSMVSQFNDNNEEEVEEVKIVGGKNDDTDVSTDLTGSPDEHNNNDANSNNDNNDVCKKYCLRF